MDLIPDEDLVVTAVTVSCGGQRVSLTSSKVEVTHMPTGISATVECMSQHRARMVAIEMIEAALTSPNFR